MTISSVRDVGAASRASDAVAEAVGDAGAVDAGAVDAGAVARALDCAEAEGDADEADAGTAASSRALDEPHPTSSRALMRQRTPSCGRTGPL